MSSPADLSPAAVSLRGRRPRDLPVLTRWLTDPDAAWREWDAPYLPAWDTTANLQRYAQTLASSPPNPNERVIDVGGVVVGMVNRAEEDPADGGWWDLGILIYDPAHWGVDWGAGAGAVGTGDAGRDGRTS